MAKVKSVSIIGGGFFGLTAALHLAKKGCKVSVYERNLKAMQEASLFNQARVHGGYHYPRSLKTAARCRANYARFLQDFQGAIFDDFVSIYAIASDSQVNYHKFNRLMEMIGAPIERLSGPLAKEFNESLISQVFKIEEVAFNSEILLKLTLEQLSALKVDIHFNTEITRVENINFQGRAGVKIQTQNGEAIESDYAILATYGLDILSSDYDFNENYLYEVCELIRVQVPKFIKNCAITVMDGPYWSLTPWPAFEAHVLTHVRHTPHARFNKYLDAREFLGETLTTRTEVMLRDASRFMPRIAECQVLGSEYTIKTILKKRDFDDSRPIYVQKENRILSVLGSKIDNIYDLETIFDEFLEMSQ